jgi:hypothetical protein
MDHNEEIRQRSFQRHLDELLEDGDTEQLHKAATMLNEAQGSSATAGVMRTLNVRYATLDENGKHGETIREMHQPAVPRRGEQVSIYGEDGVLGAEVLRVAWRVGDKNVDATVYVST